MSLVPATHLDPSRRFSSVEHVIESLRPNAPTYVVQPKLLQAKVTEFLRGFPGWTLYAVKCNPSTVVLDPLYAAGIRDFDVASLEEVALIRQRYPDASAYLMAPFQPVGAYETAYREFGIRDFAVDTEDALDAIFDETGGEGLTIFVRLATDNDDAMFDLSSKFGADRKTAVRLLQQIAARGAMPALTFHVGSQCEDPAAFTRAGEICEDVTRQANVSIQTVDVGGGFPCPYPGGQTPPLDDYFKAIEAFREKQMFGPAVDLFAEPGRALVAEGVSLVAQVILRKGNQLYLNDGAYGSFMERNLEGAAINYPIRAFRENATGEIRAFNGPTTDYTVFGPTCDSCDQLNDTMTLPADLKRGDWIEFGMMGAYSNAYASNFNGYLPKSFVVVGDPEELDAAGTVVAL